MRRWKVHREKNRRSRGGIDYDPIMAVQFGHVEETGVRDDVVEIGAATEFITRTAGVAVTRPVGDEFATRDIAGCAERFRGASEKQQAWGRARS